MSKNYDKEIQDMQDDINRALIRVHIQKERVDNCLDLMNKQLEKIEQHIANLPLKPICPICGRYILKSSHAIDITGIRTSILGVPAILQPTPEEPYCLICPVCADSLRNNEPLRQKVWADLTKKTK